MAGPGQSDLGAEVVRFVPAPLVMVSVLAGTGLGGFVRCAFEKHSYSVIDAAEEKG